jgi:peptide-methionine (R)-S-oxide reductase
MRKSLFSLLAITFLTAMAFPSMGDPKKDFPVKKSDADWRKELTPEQYNVLRQAGTDAPFRGKYTDTTDTGVYRCSACNYEIFRSDHKFHSGCGWPSFYAAAAKDHVVLRPDNSHGMQRVEVLCASCGGHLGHLFEDGPKPTGQRYCINSTSLKFEPANKSKTPKH